MRRVACAVALTFLLAAPGWAQMFSSGSTGADGALDLATMNCETGTYATPPGRPGGCWVQLPESGILNYTTINIPQSKLLGFKKNLRNTPVVLLAQGDVVVGGTIYVDADVYGPDGRFDPTQPGPGGFPGGAVPSGTGLGPGGGTVADRKGRWVGPLSLVPLIGGSGGAGSSTDSPGGGGGGAIVIASSGEIRIGIVGRVSARASAGYGGTGWPNGGEGSGGAIRMVANRIIQAGYITTSDFLSVSKPGIVRLEVPADAISYTGSSTPAPILSTINPAIVGAATPELLIVSVGGFSVPNNAGNRKDAADLVLPKQLPDPINVVVAASNIPLGSPVTVSFGTSNQGTAPAVPLAGSLASSTATIGVSGLNRDQLAYLYVQALFAPPASGGGDNDVPESERVTQVRMTNAPGAKPQFAFLRRDGAEVPADKLPAHLQTWVSSPYSR